MLLSVDMIVVVLPLLLLTCFVLVLVHARASLLVALVLLVLTVLTVLTVLIVLVDAVGSSSCLQYLWEL